MREQVNTDSNVPPPFFASILTGLRSQLLVRVQEFKSGFMNDLWIYNVCKQLQKNKTIPCSLFDTRPVLQPPTPSLNCTMMLRPKPLSAAPGTLPLSTMMRWVPLLLLAGRIDSKRSSSSSVADLSRAIARTKSATIFGRIRSVSANRSFHCFFGAVAFWSCCPSRWDCLMFSPSETCLHKCFDQGAVHHGTCEFGFCVCTEDYAGDDCSIRNAMCFRSTCDCL